MADPRNGGIPHEQGDRPAEIYRLTVVNRLTQREIATRLGITQQRVSQLLAQYREELPPIDLDAIRREALARQEQVIRMAAELAELKGAPVTAGKDGTVVYDPELTNPDGSGVVVRDYAGRVAAAKLILEADREIRKLLGADAASKTEISGGVKYEISGVTPEELI